MAQERKVTHCSDGKFRLFSWKKKKKRNNKQLETTQATALFGRFKGICSLIKVAETVSATLLGTYGGEKKRIYFFSQLCFPYPLVAFVGCRE